MNLRVHIGELVLHGFPPGDRARIADAVQAELARLFTEGGVPAALTTGGAVERIDAGGFHTAAAVAPASTGSLQTANAARTETTGAQIAQTVYGRLATWQAE